MVSSTSACLEWLLRPETVAGIRDGAPDYAQLASRLGKLSAVYAGMPGFCAGTPYLLHCERSFSVEPQSPHPISPAHPAPAHAILIPVSLISPML